MSKSKKDLRKELLSIRSQLSVDECNKKSELISYKLFSILDELRINKAACYYSYNNEVNTEGIINKLLESGVKVYLPVSYIENNKSCMDFYKIKDYCDVIEGYKGIKEPKSRDDLFSIDSDDRFDVIIVPLVGFDEDKNRIGYGKGFYDTFLSKIDSTPVIGIVYECQKVNAIPYESNDIKLSYIVTEERIY